MGRSAVGEHLQLLGLYMVPIPIKMNTNSVAPGKVPEGGKATGNNYWYCDGSKEYYHADGTFTGRFTDTNFEGYNELLTIWRACRVGTRLPEVAGNWIVVNDSICLRFDTTPGIIACDDIISEPDGNSSTVGGDLKVVQYGQVVDYGYEGTDTCYLEEE